MEDLFCFENVRLECAVKILVVDEFVFDAERHVVDGKPANV